MRQRHRLARFAAYLLMLSCSFPASTLAQNAPARPADPAFVAAAAAFERFDQVDRRAIQRDLIWTAGFQGAATGEFGALTFAALRRLDTEMKMPVNGVLSPEKRKRLAEAAEAGRKAIGFRVENDAASKMRVGVPTHLLSKRSANPAGLSRWQDEKGQITLDLSLGKPDDDLAQLFERGTATNVAGRKITYKLLRPDFFVVSGETETGKFYRRLEKGTDGTLRGFSIGYSKALSPAFDWMVIAIATSFEAQPGLSPQPTSVASTPSGGRPIRPSAPEPRRVSAIEIAPGKLVTAAAAIASCKVLHAGQPTQPARVEKQAHGLALLAFSQPNSGSLVFAPVEGEAILLQRDRTGALLTASAMLIEGRAEMPLQAGGAGAALLDRGGRLVGLVIEEPRTHFQVAGVVPAALYRFADAKIIADVAGVQAEASTPFERRSMSAIAAEAGRAVISLVCVE
ncbi:MAG: peptidoglycan-binding domain-containing protein [Rhabdaerophilum sp.]